MDIRPLSARSVVLSLLLGAHPPELTARDLVQVGGQFDIAEPTLRVALTRMVATGDLERTDSSYRLSDRLLQRQRRQDSALDPPTCPWDGAWEMVVITSAGRSASDRADLRATLGDLRLGELREGVWTRPANLARDLPVWQVDLLSVFHTVPDSPGLLADRLWDLTTWTRTGRDLLRAASVDASAARRLAVAAAIVRHLRTDPALPDQLLPAGWVAAELHATYAAYQSALVETGLALRVSPGVS